MSNFYTAVSLQYRHELETFQLSSPPSVRSDTTEKNLPMNLAQPCNVRVSDCIWKKYQVSEALPVVLSIDYTIPGSNLTYTAQPFGSQPPNSFGLYYGAVMIDTQRIVFPK